VRKTALRAFDSDAQAYLPLKCPSVDPIVYEQYLYQHYWVSNPDLALPECYDKVSRNGEYALSAEDSLLARRHFAILCTEYLVKIDIRNGNTVW